MEAFDVEGTTGASRRTTIRRQLSPEMRQPAQEIDLLDTPTSSNVNKAAWEVKQAEVTTKMRA